MKKAAKGILLGATMMLAACGGNNEKAEIVDVTTVNLYAGGSDNVKRTLESVISQFEDQTPEVKVALQFLPSGTGGTGATSRLIAAERAGVDTVDIDILEVTDNEILQIVNQAGEGALTSIDETKVPNMKDIITTSEVSEGRALNFRGTSVVLAYNADKVDNVPTTSSELMQWIEENPQRFAYNEPGTGGAGDSFLVTSVYNNMPSEAITSSDEKWVEEWNAGFEDLARIHPNIYKAAGRVQYPFKNQGALDLLATGEIDMTPMWADMLLDQKSQGLIPENIMMTNIEPAFTGDIVSFAVPEKSENKEAAYKFLNFVASSEAQELFVKEQKAIPVISSDLLDEEVLDMLSGLEVDSYRSYSLGGLMDDLRRAWEDRIATLN